MMACVMAGALLLTVRSVGHGCDGGCKRFGYGPASSTLQASVKGVISSPGLRADPVHHHWRHHGQH
ncbi:MAG: hypothetical protein R2857_06460 [Vampirovibrionales bacterium]